MLTDEQLLGEVQSGQLEASLSLPSEIAGLKRQQLVRIAGLRRVEAAVRAAVAAEVRAMKGAGLAAAVSKWFRDRGAPIEPVSSLHAESVRSEVARRLESIEADAEEHGGWRIERGQVWHHDELGAMTVESVVYSNGRAEIVRFEDCQVSLADGESLADHGLLLVKDVSHSRASDVAQRLGEEFFARGQFTLGQKRSSK